MKFIVALTSTALLASALKIKAEGDHGFDGKPGFSIGADYREPDYNGP